MQQFFDFPVDPICSFESFVPCDGNAAALRFALQVADRDNPEKLLYLHGPSGSGKTHLLKAVAARLAAESGRGDAYCTLRDRLTAEQLRCRCADAGALLVDDLQLMPDDPHMRGMLWQLFNEFHTAGRPVMMAGLVPPRELPNLDDHLVSRLLWGLVARLDTTDDESRRMILKKVADDRQVRVPDDVVDYIIATASREVRDLIESFDAVYRLSMAEKRRMTLPLARDARERSLAGDAP